MIWKKRLLRKSKIYAILDREALKERNIFQAAKRLIDSGADIIQLRDKISSDADAIACAKRLKALFKKSNSLFIIDDRTDIAYAVDADGVHLGQDDLPISAARKILGEDKIIGISTHNLQQAVSAQSQGADYIGVGPIFATPTKPDYQPVGLGLLKKAKQNIRIPFFAIGNINLSNAKQVARAGAKGIAICRPACAAEGPAKFFRLLREKLNLK